MDRENLTIEEQLELEYIDAWWERKKKKQQERRVRRYKRKERIRSAKTFFKAALKELLLYFIGFWK